MKHYTLITITTTLLMLFSIPSIAQQKTEKGYKGFATIGGGMSTKGSENQFFAEIQTTHGYQFNSQVFLGGGIGAQLFKKNYEFGDKRFLALNYYGAIRYNILDFWVTPFIEGKVGASLPYSMEASNFLKTGLYASPSVGCHLGTKNRLGFDVSLGWDYQRVPVREEGDKVNLSKVVLRFGIDF